MRQSFSCGPRAIPQVASSPLRYIYTYMYIFICTYVYIYMYIYVPMDTYGKASRMGRKSVLVSSFPGGKTAVLIEQVSH